MLSVDEAANIVDSMIKVIKKESENYLRRSGLTVKETEFISTAFLYEGFFYA